MSNEIQEVIEELGRRTDKFGLYLRNSMVASEDAVDDETKAKLESDDSLKELVESGEVKLLVFCAFSVNELAFSDRVQHPEKYDMDREFEKIMPTEAEMTAEQIRERLAKGGDILDILNLDMPTEDE